MDTTAFSLTNKTAIITGGASGIGLAIAKRFAAHGAAVEILDLQQAALDSAVAELRAAGHRAHGESCDVSDPAAVDAAFARILTRHERIHILVNNAGIAHVGNALTSPDLAATFQTAGGAIGTLLGTNALAWEFPLFDLAFNFERGRVRMQDLDGDLEIMDARRSDHERYGIPRGRSRWDQYTASFGKSIAAYLDAIRQGQPPPIPGLAGLLELQVEAGFNRSIAQCRPVRLAEEFPVPTAAPGAW